MRIKYQDTFVDGNGRVVSGGTVTVYLAGTTTLKTIYSTETGVTPVTGSAVTTATDGSFSFWTEPPCNPIKLVMSKDKYTEATYDDIYVIGSQSALYDDDVYVDAYGAVGDGVTDDSTAIQAAIADATLKRVIFSSKNYYLGTTRLLITNPVDLGRKIQHTVKDSAYLRGNHPGDQDHLLQRDH